MSNGSIESRLAQCMAAVFPQLSASELTNASASSVAAWDSLATVTLVSVVEEEFGVRFSLDDYPVATSYALLLDYLKSASASA